MSISADARGVSALTRLACAAVLGLLVGVAVALTVAPSVGVLAGWIAGAGLFVGWMAFTLLPMDAGRTRSHARREDANKPVADATLLAAAIASLGAVVLLLSGNDLPKPVQAAASVLSVALAWASVQLIFTTRYARLYYGDAPGGIGFNDDEPPRYVDFAYVAFTIGMTYQVSDTDMKSSVIRATVLRHALLSFVLGVGVIATTINLLAGLTK